MQFLIEDYNNQKIRRLDLNNWFGLQQEYYKKTLAKINMLRWVLDHDMMRPFD